jgi:hypothetical protein
LAARLRVVDLFDQMHGSWAHPRERVSRLYSVVGLDWVSFKTP